jgi:hypothetical protein
MERPVLPPVWPAWVNWMPGARRSGDCTSSMYPKSAAGSSVTTAPVWASGVGVPLAVTVTCWVRVAVASVTSASSSEEAATYCCGVVVV